MDVPHDIKGIPLRHGDLIRGFRSATRRPWKIAVEENGNFFAVDLENLLATQDWDSAYRTQFLSSDEFEIVGNLLDETGRNE